MTQLADELRATIDTAIGLHRQGHLAQAEALYAVVLQLDPASFDALRLLALVNLQKGRPAQSLPLFEAALQVQPAHAETLSNLAVALITLGSPADALLCLARALELDPHNIDAWNNQGNALRDSGQLDAALQSHQRALQLQPRHLSSLCNENQVLRLLGREEEVLKGLRRLERDFPDQPVALAHCAGTLFDLARYPEALALAETALRRFPDHIPSLRNKGVALMGLMRIEEAQLTLEHALRLVPDDPDLHWNMGLIRLLLGDYQAGWQHYEQRWLTAGFRLQIRPFAQPQWLGRESLAGRTILLHCEQGLGDTVQFCRYTAGLAREGARVLLEVPPALCGLMASLAGVTEVIARGAALPEFDFHSPLLSLPLACGTERDTIEGAPYLSADVRLCAEWEARLPPRGCPRVGLNWSGNAGHTNDRNRSMSLAQMATLLRPDIDFCSLQKEIRPADRTALAEYPPIAQFDSLLGDFADTAAMLNCLDLVITVDTSVAHLAGALGRPVWILLPFCPDWRWLAKGNQSPWYDSVRLFRQTTRGDWSGVLAEVRTALDAWLDTRAH